MSYVKPVIVEIDDVDVLLDQRKTFQFAARQWLLAQAEGTE